MARPKRYTKELKFKVDDETYKMLREISGLLGISIASAARLSIRTAYPRLKRKAEGGDW